SALNLTAGEGGAHRLSGSQEATRRVLGWIHRRRAGLPDQHVLVVGAEGSLVIVPHDAVSEIGSRDLDDLGMLEAGHASLDRGLDFSVSVGGAFGWPEGDLVHDPDGERVPAKGSIRTREH